MAEAEREELLDEIERLSLRQMTFYGPDGSEVFTMTIGPRQSRWKAGSGGCLPEVARIVVE